MLYLTPAFTVYCCFVAALLGACMGSFLNCMAWRVVHGESVLRGRSHCDVCGHVLDGGGSHPCGQLSCSQGPLPLVRREAVGPPCVGRGCRGGDVHGPAPAL